MNLRYEISSSKSETKEMMLVNFGKKMEKYDDNEMYVLIKAETLFSLGSQGHFPFPESTLPGSSRKMYSWNGESKKVSLMRAQYITLDEQY